jgi:hypothetical protein
MAETKEIVKVVPQFKIDTTGWKKVGKSILIGFGGVILTILEEQIPGLDFGKWSIVIVGINSVMINALRIWLLPYKSKTNA